MGISDITVDNLVAIDDVAGIKLEWTYDDPRPSSLNVGMRAVEVWAADANDRGPDNALLATKIGEGRTDFSHRGLARGDLRCYWIRGVDFLGNVSGWHPASQTAGVVGIELSGDVLIAEDGYWKHPSGLIEQWGTDAIAGGGGGTVVTFPLAFPTVCMQVVATARAVPVVNFTTVVTVSGTTQTQMTLNSNLIQNGGAVTCPGVVAGWRALGY